MLPPARLFTPEGLNSCSPGSYLKPAHAGARRAQCFLAQPGARAPVCGVRVGCLHLVSVHL